MANRGIHLIGQSNANFLFDYQPAVGLQATTILLTVLNALFANEHVFAMRQAAIVTPSTAGTVAGGTSLYADWFVGDGIAANSASWTLTSVGQLGLDYPATLTSGQRGEMSLIVYYWWENDTQGAVATSALHAAAVLEYITRLRAAYGKTAAQLPVLLVGPGVYSNGTVAGIDVVEQGMNAVAATSGFNAIRFTGMLRDVDWDKDAPGSYGSHGSAEDNRTITRRLGRFIYRQFGPAWAATPRRYSGAGPIIEWLEYVDATTLDVWVRHDGGTNLVLGSTANSTNGLNMWRVTVNGLFTAPTAVAIPSTGPGAGRRVRLTVPAMPGAQAASLFYGTRTTNRGGLGGTVYDNTDAVQTGIDLVLPTGLTGTERVGLPIQPLYNPIRARVGAPPLAA